MAQKFVSPGVFTNELDQSFLAQGVGAIGAVLVGQTIKGPAFVPTKVGSFQEFVERFGTLDTTMQLPYASKNYLKNAGTLTVVRVLGDSNSTGVRNGAPAMYAYKVVASGTAAAGVHGTASMGILFSSGALTLTSGATGYVLSSSQNSLVLLTASNIYGAGDFWTNVWNSDPTKYSTQGHFLYTVDGWNLSSSYNLHKLSLIQLNTSASWEVDYTNPQSTVIQSQYFGSSIYNLFEIFTKAVGDDANAEFKVSVQNIRPSVNTNVTKYGTFDVIVRMFGDTDQRPQIIETFTACTMDPNSQNYVARLIGDQYEIWNTSKRKNEISGTFQSRSKHIRVKMSDPSGVPEEAVPFGFVAYGVVTGSDFVSGAAIPWVLNQTNANGNIDTSIYWGIDFNQGTLSEHLKYLPTQIPQATLANFNMGRLQSGIYQGRTTWSYNSTVSSNYYLPLAISSSVQKFTLPFKGGFDGWDLTDSTPLEPSSDSAGDTDPRVIWLKKAIAVVANPDQYDFNLMCLPGVTNYQVNDYGRQVCNDRADALFIMDIPGDGTTDVISKINNRTIDDNYAACYYPDIIYNDKVNNRLVQTKPSVAVMGALAYNDRVGQPFFAPAGLNRGGLGQFDVVDVDDRLTYAERSDLYDARINPIASFPVEGIVIFGQKTLQVKPSSLDRINVRRLLIYSKKLIASAAKYLLFEPNNPNTWQRFLNQVNPILDKIRQDQGIERFKVVMDSTVNTPDLVDRNIMTGKIFLQPTRSAEFIDLQFIITSSGVSFEE
jgi:hypothetical protein